MTAPARHETNLEIVRRYTGQCESLPRPLRHEIEARMGGEPVQLYALVDLDPDLNLCTRWLVLAPKQVAVALRRDERGDAAADEGKEWLIECVPRERIHDVRLTPGLSCSTLTLLGRPGEPALLVARFTHRQLRAVENIKFVLEEALEGRDVPTGDGDTEYAESLARPIREAQALVSGHQHSVLVRLLSYMKPYRGRVALGMGAALLITLFSLVPPLLAGHLIDEVSGPVQTGRLDPAQARTTAWLAVAAIGTVYLLRQLCAFVRLRTMAVIGEWVARDLRTELYEHLQKLSLSFFNRKKTGSLITRVSSDTDRLWEFLALGVVDVSLSIVMLLGLGTVLLTLDWRLGLLMTLPVPLLCYAIFLFGERLNSTFIRAWRKWSNVTDVLSDTIPGMRVVKAFNQEARETARFGRRNYAVTDEFNNVHKTWTVFWPMLMLAIHGMTLAVWAFALPRLLGSEGEAPTLALGTFVSFLLYTTMFVAPIEIIGQMARAMNRATSSAFRVFEVLDSEPEVVDRPSPVRLSPVRGHVRFEDVTFGYDGVRQVIRGVNIEVLPGEMIGLVGPSGGGKTTLVNLVARFYDVTGGRITVDGVDIRDLDAGHYRRQVGMVLQDPYLFHGSVLDNIRYGNPEAGEAEVVSAAIAANAHDFVCRLEHGYDTVVGERGQSLSGGERQRISIARAILSDPRILILDEATSAVDTETERNIQEALDRLTAGRTVFAIAHRLSTLARADRLLVVEGGRISESGSHTELLQKPEGTYRRLHDMQRELAHGA